MTAQEINLRQARPDHHEGRAFAHYLNMAAEGFFQFMLGNNFQDIITRAYLQPGHDLSFENVHFAEQNGAIVGMFSGFTGEQHRQSPKDILLRAAGPWHIRARIIKFLFEPMMSILDSIEASDYYLQAIAVDSNLQGRGVGSLLLTEVETLARNSGAKRLALDVAGKNLHARSLYERRGFVVVSSWPNTIRLSFLKLHRMVKQLD